MILSALLQAASTQLTTISDCPEIEAQILLAHVLQKNRTYLLAHGDQDINQNDQNTFSELLSKRINGVPIAYLLKRREFWSLDLEVSEATLIPRPETECLVEKILSLYPETNSHCRLADLGTGTGAIALAIAKERPHWQIVATDVSQSALMIASKNAQRLGLGHISFLQGNWCTALLAISDAKFDIIVSNPPYIAEIEWEGYKRGLLFEPREALVSGIDGLDAIRVIVEEAKTYLKVAGYLIIEHGFSQGEKVRELFKEAGFKEISTHLDLAGKERMTVGKLV